MDVQSGVVCALVFVASAVLLLVISKFGMREKSYEEALAEQRKLTSGLLGPQHRAKPKEKKQKKVGKKVKEKVAPRVVETSTEESEAAEGNGEPPKHHVEFEEPAVAVAAELPPTNNNKKRAKKEKVKPILVNKEKSPAHEVDSSKSQVATNNFEQTHPKDAFELLSSHQKDDAVKQEPEVKPKKAMHQEDAKSKTKEKKQSAPAPLLKEAPPQEPAVQEQIVTKVQPASQQANGVKDKKKKKSEFNTLQQLTAGDKNEVTVSLLVALVRKSELSRSEIQILIDLLLNKQHEAPTVIDEWSEGRADPVQKLKKQLAEKERALAEEQEALASAQAKLREIRTEFNQERSRLTQNCRNLEENLLAKRTEVQSAGARMHAQGQQCQQLQVQLNDEMAKTRAISDELKTMHVQRQQLDMHITQKQETEASIQSQLGQLRSELQEAQAVIMELRTIREKNHAEKDMLHDRLRQTESKALHYKNEADQKQELLMELEDSRRMYGDLKLTFDALLRNEGELKMLCQQHSDEARRIASITHEDLNKLQSEINRLTVLNKSQDNEHKRIIADLQSQLSSIQAVGDKSKEVEIRNLQNELSSLRAVLLQRESDLSADVDQTRKIVADLEGELIAQKSKNDMAAKQLQSDEQFKYKAVLLRLFPQISQLDTVNWLAEAEHCIKSYVAELQAVNQTAVDTNLIAEVERLQMELRNYRITIDDTESFLKQIQSEVGNEESKWRQQLASKDAEIKKLKDDHQKQLQIQLSELSEQLRAERLLTPAVDMPSKSTGNSLASVELMAEEQNSLADDLVREQKRNRDLSEEIQHLKSLTESQPIKALPNHTANGTTTLETFDIAAVN